MKTDPLPPCSVWSRAGLSLQTGNSDVRWSQNLTPRGGPSTRTGLALQRHRQPGDQEQLITQHKGKWEMHREVIAQEQLNASVTLAKLNFTIPGLRILGKSGRKEDRPGWKK